MTSQHRRNFLKKASGLTLSGALFSVSQYLYAAQTPDSGLREFLRSGNRFVDGIELRHTDKLAEIYSGRGYIPLWHRDTQVTKTSLSILRKLEYSPLMGQHASHYYTRILSSWSQLQDSRSSMNFELLLTDSLYEYLDNIANGQTRQQPGSQKAWFQKQSRTDVQPAAMGFFRGEISFLEAVDRIQPVNPRYNGLLLARQQYQEILHSGGFTAVPEGRSLQEGESSSRVRYLRDRLVQSGDLTPGSSSGTDTYDWALVDAVKAFQHRHGLEPDGILGKQTLSELNVSAQQRISQIEVNLDRWRWLPHDLGSSHVAVNIAGYDMDLILDNHKALSMDVVVGKKKHKTPVFSDTMEHLVFRPSWNVPKSIASKELLPKELANPGHLQSKNFVAVSHADNSSRSLSSFDSYELQPSNFTSRYRLRQKPGTNNALGSVKFMFPNRHSIYLHDTPAKTLFGKIARAFSHGCVRVAEPESLARTLLQYEGMDGYDIDNIINGTSSKTVNLRNRLPVFLTYQTSWVDQYGKVHFRKDIYDHDKVAIRTRQEQRPSQQHKESQLLAGLGLPMGAAHGG